jgi:DNA-binding HxlR family transcriptional regulator
MLGKDYSNQVCGIAGALEVVGERWSLLILRDIFLGLRRFDEIQDDLGIARNVLQARLSTLTDAGVLERRLYQERPPRYEYLLTEKGLDLWPALVALMKWGDRYVIDAAAGAPTIVEHAGCGGSLDDHLICERCGEPVSVRQARARPGPGATPGHPLLRRRGGSGAVAGDDAAGSRARTGAAGSRARTGATGSRARTGATP